MMCTSKESVKRIIDMCKTKIPGWTASQEFYDDWASQVLIYVDQECPKDRMKDRLVTTYQIRTASQEQNTQF